MTILADAEQRGADVLAARCAADGLMARRLKRPALKADLCHIRPRLRDPSETMRTITSSERLLALPVHERRTLVVLPDRDLREIEQLASTQQADQLEIEQEASTDQVAKLLELAVGLGGAVGASKAAGAAVDRAREIVRAGASRAAATSPTMVPALALGVLGIGAGAFLFKSRNGNPVNVTFVSASTAQDLTFSEGPFELGGVYTVQSDAARAVPARGELFADHPGGTHR